MTREEAIRCLSVHSSTNGSGLCTDKQHYEAKQVAIKALEQEPCEDAISRQAAIEVIAATDITNGEEPVFTGKQVIALLKDLDSVIPSRATGHWIETWLSFWCSECKTQFGGAYKFCPNCGAHMVESEGAE